jgi:DNA-binding HxlR family transcriptional regulator
MSGVKRTDLSRHPCSIARSLDIVGEWWTPLILRDIAYGIRRFGEIQADLGISANVLTDRLASLQGEGLLDTHIYQKRPERHEYRLTAKGAELIPALLALMQWGDRWTWSDGHGPVRVVHGDCDHEARVELRCEHCERELTPFELLAKTRGPVSPSQRENQPGRISAQRLCSSKDGVRLGA